MGEDDRTRAYVQSLYATTHVRRPTSTTPSDKPLLIRLPSRTTLLSRRQVRKRVRARRKLAVLVVLVHKLVVLDMGRELCGGRLSDVEE